MRTPPSPRARASEAQTARAVAHSMCTMAVASHACASLWQVFGDRGYHARSAIGTNTLPLDVAVEVEAILIVKPK